MSEQSRREAQGEIDRDRRAERRLVAQALLALAVVAVFVLLREAFIV